MNQFDYQRSLFASDLSSNAKLVGCVIGSHFNWKTWEYAFPSNKTIARESGLSISSVTRAKRELVSQGHLVSARRFNDSNTYTPLRPKGMVSKTNVHGQDGQLKDTLKDTLKDNKDRSSESKDSSDTNILNLNKSEKDSDTINIMDWFDNGYPQRDKRTAAAGRRHQDAGRIDSNPRRNDPDHAEVSRFIEDMAGARKQDW